MSQRHKITSVDDIDMEELAELDRDQIEFASFLHHFKVRSALGKMVDAGVIDAEDGEYIYTNWKDNRNQ